MKTLTIKIPIQKHKYLLKNYKYDYNKKDCKKRNRINIVFKPYFKCPILSYIKNIFYNTNVKIKIEIGTNGNKWGEFYLFTNDNDDVVYDIPFKYTIEERREIIYAICEIEKSYGDLMDILTTKDFEDMCKDLDNINSNKHLFAYVI